MCDRALNIARAHCPYCSSRGHRPDCEECPRLAKAMREYAREFAAQELSQMSAQVALLSTYGPQAIIGISTMLFERAAALRQGGEGEG